MPCRCYFAVSICGYWAFGINVADNVLMTDALKSTVPNGVIIAADIMVVIHVLGSFQVYSMPVCSSACAPQHASLVQWQTELSTYSDKCVLPFFLCSMTCKAEDPSLL